jgi:hypothetical protein
LPIQSYSDLQTAIGDYVDGAKFDPALMIQLAEADFRRQIVATEQDTQVTLDTNTLAIPADADSIKGIAITGANGFNGPPSNTLEPVTLAAYYNFDATWTAQPRQYAIAGQSILLWPSPDQDYTAIVTYRQMIPTLSDANPTNWLLATHPDAYLFASVLQAEFYGWNDARLPILQAKLAAILDDINQQAQRKRFGGPLRMRSSVSDRLPC